MKYVTVYIEPLETISSEIYKQLYRLNSGLSGRMQSNLNGYQEAYRNKLAGRHASNAQMKDAKIFYILKRGKVVSWAVVYHPMLDLGRFGKRWEMDIFTRVSERGKGYASAIAETVREEFAGTRISACKSMTSVYRRNKI